MIEQRRVGSSWLRWFLWVLFSMFGWLILSALVTLMNDWAIPMEGVIFVGVTLLAGIAALQWVLLRPYLVIAWRWIAASTAGFVIGTLIALPLKVQDWYVPPSGFQMDEVAYGVVLGLILGVAQWLPLRGRLQNSGLWVLASAIGWGLGHAAGELIPLDWTRAAAGSVYMLVVTLVAVAFTGFALVLLLPVSDPGQPKENLPEPA